MKLLGVKINVKIVGLKTVLVGSRMDMFEGEFEIEGLAIENAVLRTSSLSSVQCSICVIWTCTHFTAATASFSLLFTAPLLAAKHFRLLALRCGTACHRRLRRSHLWLPFALDSRRSCSLSHFLTFDSSDIYSTYCL